MGDMNPTATLIPNTPVSAGSAAGGDPFDSAFDPAFDAVDELVLADRSVNIAVAKRLRLVHKLLRLERGNGDPHARVDAELVHRSVRAEIATALRISERSAEVLIGYAEALHESLPVMASGFDAGDFSYPHVQILIDHTIGLSPKLTAELERKAVPKASRLTPARFTQFVRRTREALDPMSTEERAETAFQKRSVVEEAAVDGMAILTVSGKAIHIQAIMDRVSKAAVAMKRAGDTRTIAQLRSDLITQVLLHSNDGVLEFPVPPIDDTDDDTDAVIKWFRGIIPTVMVTVPVFSLLDPDSITGTADLEGYGPISLADARILAAKSPSFTRILTHPISQVVLAVDRKSYKVPKHLRRWLRVRDGTCRFPGCGRLAKYCDIDHTRAWFEDTGPTNHNNLAHLCRGHHTLKGNTDWTVTQDPGGSGVLTWTTPTGHHHTTEPAIQLPH